MYLLDTDILLNLMKGAPPAALVARLASVSAEAQFTSTVALGELVYGARRLGTLTDTLLERLESVLLPNLPVLPFDADAARKYGELRAELEVQGILPGDAELRVAAIALSRDLTVVTGNAQRFQGIPGLAVECWLEEPTMPAGGPEEPMSSAYVSIELSLRRGSSLRQDQAAGFVPDPRDPYGWLPKSSSKENHQDGGSLPRASGAVGSSKGLVPADADARRSDQQVRRKGPHYSDLGDLALSP